MSLMRIAVVDAMTGALLTVARRFWAVTAPGLSPSIPLADPLQVIHDVRRSPSPDRDQTEQVLRNWLRTVVGTGAGR